VSRKRSDGGLVDGLVCVFLLDTVHSKKMLGCFNSNLGQIWTNPNVGLKMQLKNLKLKGEI